MTWPTPRVAESVEEVGDAAWSALVAACDAPAFYGYDFLRSIETLPLTYPSAARYLLAEGPSGELAAALPLYLQRTTDPFGRPGERHAPVQALLGHVWHCYDTQLLSRAPLSRELVARFWDALTALAARYGAQLWGLVNIALEEPLAQHLRAIGVPVEPTVPRYRLPLRPDGPACLDQHLATIGRASRRTLRLYRNRAERAGAQVITASGPAAPDVLELCLKTADKHAPGYYPPERLGALIEHLGEACQVIRLELAGRLLATSICLYDKSRIHAWSGGSVYPAELNWSPQYVLFAAELQTAMASGLPMMECGRRNDEFKSRHGLRPYQLGRAVRRA
jgi:hypothetical protein